LDRVGRSAGGGGSPGDGKILVVIAVSAGNQRLVLAGARLSLAGRLRRSAGLARQAGRAGSRHGHPLLNVRDNKAERTVDTLAACQLPEDSTEIRAAALSPTLRGSGGGSDAVRHRHGQRRGRASTAHWIRGFTALERTGSRVSWRSRARR